MMEDVKKMSYTETLMSWERPDLRVGIPVTVKYPLVPTEKPPEYRGKPHIDPNVCIGCGACVQACPANALTAEWDFESGLKSIVSNPARCIRCGRCQEACPTGAMKLTLEFELATPNKKDLVEVVEHHLTKCKKCGKYTEFTERQVKKALQILPKEIIEARALEEKMQLCRECRMEESVKALATQEHVIGDPSLLPPERTKGGKE